MWATSSLISESGCSESSRGVRLECDPNKHRLTITHGADDLDASGLNVQMSDQEIVTDLLATLPKLKAAVDDHENRAPNWLRKSKHGESVEVYELLPTRDGKGDDMDIVHSVVATIEIECHLNEVLNVLTSHKTNHDLEASMRAIIPKKKIRQGEVLLQPHATTLDGGPVTRRGRKPQPSSRGGKSVRFDNMTIPEDEEEEERRLYEVEQEVGAVSKKRLCVRCITNVDSCLFEDEDFMTALGPAVIDDDYDYDYDEEYDSECDYDRRDDNDTYASLGSTVACSEFESGGSPDDVSTELYPENVVERSMALQTLDRLVNSQINNGKQTLFERSQLNQSQLSQKST
ncbi:hypothetical protein PHMEG_00020998 [Phytophthora megakarya]|uniref:Uncharacterized protein n=1 Tax=Phytophthora megakarya TaxID=4795 RepID=A0A225VMZ6_9STRA|nr:hypothetical protein PHMEG_00020998 [Phytophthora megakarya]